MKKVSLFLVLLVVSIFFSCEETVKNPNLEYEPKLVIRAFLFPNETLRGITIMMTKPPLASSEDIQNSFISNANVTISTQGKSFKCSYNGSSYYCNDLYLQEGQTYHLSVKYKNMTATATTIIPIVNVDSVYYEIDSNKFVWGTYRAKMYAKVSSSQPFSCYAIELSNDTYKYDGTFTYRDAMVSCHPKTNNNVLLEVLIDHNFDYLMYDIINWQYTLVVCDEQMYKYYITKSDYDDWDLFGPSGTNPMWNIKYDGIGLFIGCNKKEITIH
jgi:hypothetical protein